MSPPLPPGAEGFSYPRAYLRARALGLPPLAGWTFHSDHELLHHAAGLAERYPDRCLIPFARCEGSDDVVCFEPGGAHEVARVHDYASPGWEDEGGCAFREWFFEVLGEHLEGEPAGE